MLQNILDSLEPGSNLHQYLMRNCSALLAPMTGNTGLVVGPNGMPTSVDGILKPVVAGEVKTMRSDTKGRSGVYMFVLGVQLYFGCALDLYTRYKYHLNMSVRRAGTALLYAVMLPIKWKGAYYAPVVTVTNYSEGYTAEVGPWVSEEELVILQAFTQFHIRLYEQALITYYSSILNGHTAVVFPFMSWSPGQKPITTGTEIEATSVETGETLSFSSIGLCATTLGLAQTTMLRVINTGKALLTKYGQYLFVDPARPDHLRAQNWSHEKPTVQGIDLEELPTGVLLAYRSDKITLFGSYASPTDAMNQLDPGRTDNKYIRRWINKEHLVTVTPDKVRVYFVMNPAYASDSKARARSGHHRLDLNGCSAK